MKHKILIADDSLTIQKVIKITLASEPFELYECTDAAQLNSQLDEVQPSIILLDFNLSEEKTGYDLAREIRGKIPNSKVLMLFGTFDTIDESLLEESGINHKIVKPFDGTKFINLCRVMADEIDTEDAESISDVEEDFNTNDFPEPIVDKKENDENTEIATEQEADIPEAIDEDDSNEKDEWVVEGSQSFEEEEDEPEEEPKDETVETKSSNPLESEMQDWGMDVPGVIGVESPTTASQIPGVITENTQEDTTDSIEENAPVAMEESEVVAASTDEEETKLPIDDDLAYPDEIFEGAEENIPAQLESNTNEEEKLPSSADLEYPDIGGDTPDLELEKKDDGPKLRTLDIDDDQEDEPVVDDLNVSEGGTDTDEAVNALKAELKDELEDKVEESDDLWGADVVVEDEQPQVQTSGTEETTSEDDSFHATQEEDLPHVESHQLEKVVDNTSEQDSSEDSFEFDDDSFEEVHDMSGPEDFPLDVMEEESEQKEQASDKHPAAQQFQAPSIDTKDLENELKEKLTPVVEEFVKDYCRENIEKIAWEVIPDLAENLIKKEIQRISDSIIDP